jgi:hypothetical protein
MTLILNEKISDQRPHRYLSLYLGLTGLISALTTIGVAYPLGQLHLDFAPGAILGVLISGCLMYCGLLRNPLGIIGIAVASTLAEFTSIMVAGAVELHPPFGMPRGHENIGVSTTALFAGGLVGAFVLLSAYSLSVNPGSPWWRQLLKALAWSPLGGVLGSIGWQLGPSLGMAVWEVAHSVGLTPPTETFRNALFGETSHAYALSIVWQTGVGALLGLIIPEQKNDR